MIRQYNDNPHIATVFLRGLLDKTVTTIVRNNAANANANFKYYAAHVSLIGSMALQFKGNMIDLSKDKEPSVARTVRRIVSSLKDMFFSETHENVRNEIAATFIAILENCFENKRYGRENKKAKDLIYQPLFEEL